MNRRFGEKWPSQRNNTSDKTLDSGNCSLVLFKSPFAKHVHFFLFVASLQMNLSTLGKINADAVNNPDGFVRSRLLPAEVSILVVLSSHLRAAVNNLSEQVEAKMHWDREKPSSCTGEEKHCVPSLISVPAVIAVFNRFRYESCT